MIHGLSSNRLLIKVWYVKNRHVIKAIQLVELFDILNRTEAKLALALTFKLYRGEAVGQAGRCIRIVYKRHAIPCVQLVLQLAVLLVAALGTCDLHI